MFSFIPIFLRNKFSILKVKNLDLLEPAFKAFCVSLVYPIVLISLALLQHNSGGKSFYKEKRFINIVLEVQKLCAGISSVLALLAAVATVTT